MRKIAILIGLFCFLGTAHAEDKFSFTLEWGDIPECLTGRAKTVTNPIFTLQNVPDGTVSIRFTMKDLDAPNYNHGGGKVKYTGQNVIEAGTFKYKSPCPPNGVHTYRWRALAKDANGKTIGRSKTEKKYPE